MNGDLSPKELLKKIGKIRFMERCKLTTQKRTKMNGDVSVYYALQPWDRESQTTRSLPVPKNQREAFDKAHEAYQEFKKLVRQYEEMIIRRTRAEIRRRYGG
jgi:hypothetical protein